MARGENRGGMKVTKSGDIHHRHFVGRPSSCPMFHVQSPIRSTNTRPPARIDARPVARCAASLKRAARMLWLASRPSHATMLTAMGTPPEAVVARPCNLRVHDRLQRPKANSVKPSQAQRDVAQINSFARNVGFWAALT